MEETSEIYMLNVSFSAKLSIYSDGVTVEKAVPNLNVNEKQSKS